MKTLTDEEAASRAPKNLRIAASTSFSEKEVLALEEIVNKLLRGSDLSGMKRAPEVASIARKTISMKQAVERQKVRRAARAATKTSDDAKEPTP